MQRSKNPDNHPHYETVQCQGWFRGCAPSSGAQGSVLRKSTFPSGFCYHQLEVVDNFVTGSSAFSFSTGLCTSPARNTKAPTWRTPVGRIISPPSSPLPSTVSLIQTSESSLISMHHPCAKIHQLFPPMGSAHCLTLSSLLVTVFSTPTPKCGYLMYRPIQGSKAVIGVYGKGTHTQCQRMLPGKAEG